MNILEAEDMVKGLPDQVLFQYAQNPPPQIPQYLAVSEVQRRQDMRQRFQAQSQGQQPTVMDQILQGGSPEQAPQGGPPGGAPPGAAPPGAPMEQPMTGAPMGGMFRGGMTRMANGGLTPGGIVYMQEGRTVPGIFSLQHQLPGLYNESGELKPAAAAVRDFLAPRRRAQFSVIREAEALRSQGRLDEAVALLRSEGIDPSRVLGERPAAPPAAPAAAPAAAPGSTDFMAAQSGQPPMNFSLPANFGMPSAASVSQPQAAPQAAPPAPPAPNVAPGGIGDLAPRQPRAGGMSVTGMASELFKPQEVSEQEQALINLINQQREQGVPEPLNLEPYRQAALQRQQEARDEARRMAIANTLMGLGTGLVAGDPAAGLQRATQMATETLREGRKEAQAEGRSAEALQLQAAQQARQAQIEKMQFDRESLGTVANIYKDLNKSNKESRERALQIFATYDSSLQSNLSRMQEQGALDRRSILSAITAAEDRIEDALEAQVGMTAEDKDKIRTTMRERAIRQVGSLFPNLDVEGMIGGGGSQGATANRFSVREVKPGQ